MRFLTHMFAVLLAISLMMAGQGAFAKAKTKAHGKTLPTLTFDQVAQLPYRERVEYVAKLRQATRDIEKYQKIFEEKYVGAGNYGSHDKYAVLENQLKENLSWIFGNFADADVSPMECIHSGNVSNYPKADRVPFRCQEVTCAYNPQVRNSGNLCNFTVFGTINATDIGCINPTNKALATQECWDNRQHLIDAHKTQNDDLINKVNAYFGFCDKCEFNFKEGFDSQSAKNLISALMVNSYDDRVYAMLIKADYFYKRSGKCFANDLPYVADTTALSGAEKTQLADTQAKIGFTLSSANGGACKINDDIKDEFNNLNGAVQRIYKRFDEHCAQKLEDKVVNDIRDGANLQSKANPNGAVKGTTAYKLETDRQKNLASLAANDPATHRNVLEKPECQRLDMVFGKLGDDIKQISATFPTEKTDKQPPNVPVDPRGPDDRYTKIEQTGCNDNVTDGDLLSQDSARCMACVIQNYETKKQGDDPSTPRYRTSKKYLSLMSTMALACGDGRVNDNAVLPEVMVDYWHAFGHCSNDTYEWEDKDQTPENKKLIQSWNLKNDTWRPSGDEDKDKKLFNPKKNPNHPDHDKNFLKIYGLSFDTATKIFCPKDRYKKTFFTRRINGYKAKEWKTDREEVFKMQRAAFNQNKYVKNDDPNVDSSADRLMACFKEAQENTKSLELPEPPQQMDNRTTGETLQCLNDNFLSDPPVIFARNSCYIPQQRETYKTLADNQTPCLDKNRDGKDDRERGECSGKSKSGMLWVKATDKAKPDKLSVDGYKRFSMALGSGDNRSALTLLTDELPSENENQSIMSTSCLGASAFVGGGSNNAPSRKAK